MMWWWVVGTHTHTRELLVGSYGSAQLYELVDAPTQVLLLPARQASPATRHNKPWLVPQQSHTDLWPQSWAWLPLGPSQQLQGVFSGSCSFLSVTVSMHCRPVTTTPCECLGGLMLHSTQYNSSSTLWIWEHAEKMWMSRFTPFTVMPCS